MIKRILKHFVDVYIFHKKLNFFEKRKFSYFGKGSYIGNPLRILHPEKIFVGDKVSISKNARLEIFPNSEGVFPNIFIGDETEIIYNVSILAGADILIGKKVLIASNVLITSENHGIDPESLYSYKEQELNTSPVIIEDKVWIGEKAIILPGVTIGEGSVIGAGSVVTKDVPAYSVAVGNPAIVVKTYNFETHKWEKDNV